MRRVLMNRNVGLCIVFSVLTCGIYGIYWFYKLTEEISDLSGDHSISPGLAILFTLITCGIYGIYWCFKMGKLISDAEKQRNMAGSDDSVLYLILAIFGLHIVVY